MGGNSALRTAPIPAGRSTHMRVGGYIICTSIPHGASAQEKRVHYNAHEDIMGSASYYTKQTGEVYEEHVYDAWGGVMWSSGHGVNDGKTLVVEPNYTGHSYDPILKIYHAEARFYDASTRQWMASDPIKDGLNWYEYVASNPVNFVDPTGLFIVVVDTNGTSDDNDDTYTGTQMEKGAVGNDVAKLNNALRKAGIANNNLTGVFDGYTEKAVREYQSKNGLEVTGVADPDTWMSLDLPYNTNIANEFPVSNPKGLIPSLQMTMIAGPDGPDGIDTIIVKYFPRFYAQEFAKDAKGSDLYSKSTQEKYNEYVEAFKKGVDFWATPDNDYVIIQGRKVHFDFEVIPTRSPSKATATVRFEIDNSAGGGYGVVPNLFTQWTIAGDKNITLRVDENNITELAKHEVGHVFGIFDPYNYNRAGNNALGGAFFGGISPEDYPDRIRNNSIMYNDTNYPPQLYPVDQEMMLYAFSHNAMQLYYPTYQVIFGAEESQAFFR